MPFSVMKRHGVVSGYDEDSIQDIYNISLFVVLRQFQNISLELRCRHCRCKHCKIYKLIHRTFGILSSQGVSQVYVLLRRASVFAVSSAQMQCPFAKSKGYEERIQTRIPMSKIFTMQNTIDIEQSQWGSPKTRAGDLCNTK